MKVRRLSLIAGLTLLLVLALVATIMPASLRSSPSNAGAAPLAGTFHAFLKGFKESSPNASAATGTARVVLNGPEDMITVDASFTGLSSNATAGHIHDQEAGVAGPVIFPFAGVPAATSGSIPQQTFAISPAQVAELKAGGYYVNIHNAVFPGGEVRGQLVKETYTASLDPTQEVGGGGSGTGTGEVGLSGDESKVIVDLGFEGLSDNASAAHIHQAAAGVDGPIIIPLTGVPAATSGRIPEQPHAITAGQVADLRASGLYFNVHSGAVPAGEIRGQISGSPTRVRVSSASATRTPRGVLVRWRTASEVGTAGFNVYREPAGLTKLNGKLIRSKSTGTAKGHSYSWLDRGAKAGATRYRIDAVSVQGARSWAATAVARR